MAKQKEAIFRDRAMGILKKLPNTWFTRIEQQTIRGTPDVLGCVNGAFVALEFKSSQEANVTQLQILNLQNIDKSGGMAFVVYPENFNEVFQTIKDLSNGGNNAYTKI